MTHADFASTIANAILLAFAGVLVWRVGSVRDQWPPQ